MMTIVIAFLQSGYRTFKDYFLRYVTTHLRWTFPRLVSYTRFVELMQTALVPLCAYLQTRQGTSPGGTYNDSTLLAACSPCANPTTWSLLSCLMAYSSAAVR